MMRAAVLATMLLAVAPASAEPSDVDGLVGWFVFVIKGGDWALTDVGTNGAVFNRPPTGSWPARMMWERIEWRTAQPHNGAPYLSLAQIEQFDCQDGKERPLQISRYPENNLLGAPTVEHVPESNWSYPVPDTIQAKVLATACKR